MTIDDGTDEYDEDTPDRDSGRFEMSITAAVGVAEAYGSDCVNHWKSSISKPSPVEGKASSIFPGVAAKSILLGVACSSIDWRVLS